MGITQEIFQGSLKIRKIIVSEGIQFWGDKVFTESSLEEVRLPDTLKEIGECAFSFTKVKVIILPKFLTKISRRMFAGCYELSNVVLPEKCKVIEERAFEFCHALHEIQIPPNISSIADNAFEYAGLKTIYCCPGSCAEEYARKHGIQCKPL